MILEEYIIEFKKLKKIGEINCKRCDTLNYFHNILAQMGFESISENERQYMNIVVKLFVDDDFIFKARISHYNKKIDEMIIFPTTKYVFALGMIIGINLKK